MLRPEELFGTRYAIDVLGALYAFFPIGWYNLAAPNGHFSVAITGSMGGLVSEELQTFDNLIRIEITTM